MVSISNMLVHEYQTDSIKSFEPTQTTPKHSLFKIFIDEDKEKLTLIQDIISKIKTIQSSKNIDAQQEPIKITVKEKNQEEKRYNININTVGKLQIYRRDKGPEDTAAIWLPKSEPDKASLKNINKALDHLLSESQDMIE